MLRKSRIGKIVGDALYVHSSALSYLPNEGKAMITQAKAIVKTPFTLVKLTLDSRGVSFLLYKDFDESKHPELIKSTKVDLETKEVTVRNYGNNPPILHRKETFVHPSYPLYEEFKAQTKKEEELGLLSRKDIGTKNQWESLLKKYKIEARLPYFPEALFKEITDFVSSTALAYLFKGRLTANKKLAKKYNVAKKVDKKMEVNEYFIKQADLKYGTLKEDPTRILVAVMNEMATTHDKYAMFVPGKNFIMIYQPHSVRDIDELEIQVYLDDVKGALHHELIHALQFNTQEGIGGKDDRKQKNYMLQEHEYKPQLLSSVVRFKKDLELQKHLGVELTWKNVEQFLAIKVNKSTFGGRSANELTSDEFFLELKKHKVDQWKKAVKDFLTLTKDLVKQIKGIK